MFALKRQLRGGALQKVVSSPSSLLWVNQGRYLPSIRYQSNITENKVEPKDANGSISDAEVDSWLEAIESLRSEFTDQQFLPETSLAGPGQSKINIMEEALNAKKTATVTEEQQAEWDALKAVPLPARKDEILQHVTNMIMRHGKKQRAEKALSRALYLVFCHTRQDPVQVLKKSLDDLAPLMVVKTFKTGVAKAAVIPVPLNARQRNRMAWKWIVEGANKRASSDFAVRLGEELISVFKGNSSGFDKRDQMHKTAIAHRAYIRLK